MSEREDDENYRTGEAEEESAVDEGGEEQETEDEHEEKVPEVPLTEEVISECLSLLCKTGDGLAHAYVRLDVHDRDLSDISILNSFIHLRYVDLSKNNLRDISALNSLTHLITLKLDGNLMSSARLEELPYLQIASFGSCKINTMEGISHPLLEHLIINFNEIRMIKGLNPSSLTRLHTLELRGNKLTSTEGLNLPNLKNLFLGGNLITEITGLERLEHLTTLHLRDNQIEKLDGFSENMKQLQYINLRGNAIADSKEITKLKCLALVRAIVLSENPVSDEDDYRMEALIAVRRLERLDKDEYTEDERQEAQEVYATRVQEELAAATEQMLEEGEEN